MELLALPDDPLVHILSFLDYKDLTSCSIVCRRLLLLTTSSSRVWKKQCDSWWGIDRCKDGMTWKQTFFSWYHDFGRYISIYLLVRDAWKKIEDFVSVHCPRIYESLLPGVTEEDLDQFEQKHDIKLPDDVRCVYRLHNGQNFRSAKPLPFGVFGSFMFSRFYCSESMLPLNDTVVLQSSDLPSTFLGVLACLRSKTVVYVCLDDALETHPAGCVCYIMDRDRRSPSRYNNKPLDVYIKDNNFLSWFTTYANELKEAFYPVNNGEILSFHHDADAVAVTNHVRISAATAFLPMMSSLDPPNYGFAYRITLSMDSGVHPRHACQLETRQWVITDENGAVETVNGPGVVGEYPVVRPGSNYSYISCTTFNTEKGTMHGTYSMRNLQTGDSVDVVVPVFRMVRPPCLILPGTK